MGYGPIVVHTVTMSSAGTLSTEANVSTSWDRVFLEVPTMNSNTQLHVQAANSSGGTYRRVKQVSINSSSVQTADYGVASSATNVMVPIPAGFRFLKIESTATVDNGCVFRIICS